MINIPQAERTLPADAAYTRSVSVVLPWPPTALSPNTRSHWSALARAKKAYRAACSAQALAQGVRRIKADRLHLSLTFYPPTRRAYDLDNALASVKAGLDGLADVLGVDDSRWSLSIAKAETIGGYVRVEVTQ